MPRIRILEVSSHLPESISALGDLAHNLWWAWNHEGIELFRRISPEEWESSGRNPVRLLGQVSQDRLRRVSEDDSFVAHMERVLGSWRAYMQAPTWFNTEHGTSEQFRIAYFSAEFGIADCLPIYSGGLGILAGDHLKAASDLGIPLVGVGLLYRHGYFRQYLNADGWQQETYPPNDFFHMPVRRVEDQSGAMVTVSVEIANRSVRAKVWQVDVGRVPLFLLDTDLEENAEADRHLTSRLYGGNQDTRIQQEILLGVGGLRALATIGIEPAVCHMNEGHAAFLAIERIAGLMEREGLSYREAKELTVAGTVFTTHTPVPAGNDVFSGQMVRHYLAGYQKRLGIPWKKFLGLGRHDKESEQEPFGMTVLALGLSCYRNGVSALHGQVSRNMWHRLWAGVPVEEVPITSITNGIHTRSWISSELATLYDRYLGPKWIDEPSNHLIWERVHEIPDSELWRSHERRRERLVAFARRRLAEQIERRGGRRSDIRQAADVLDPEALTIGFARRFATYKRGGLIFQDVDRLARILNDTDRPVQLIFAGKAHPADDAGKDIIRQIIHYCRDDRFRRRVLFLEDYDMNVARYMVQGVDVWLNTPVRPMEASGTSGMKAAANAALNFSVPDGWWCEGYNGRNGWNVGSGEDYADEAYRNMVESKTVYEVLEREIVPTFYERGPDGLPRAWIARMKNCLATLVPVFNTNRMVEEYAERFYIPCATRWHLLAGDSFNRARFLARWKERITLNWPGVHVSDFRLGADEPARVGAPLGAEAKVHLGEIETGDVVVQLAYGPLDSEGSLVSPDVTPMRLASRDNGVCVYQTTILCNGSGRYGYAVRVLPLHDDLSGPFEAQLISWAE